MGESVSNGKTLVANAITAKGVSTSTSAEFETMATNIGKISVSPKITQIATGTSSATGSCKKGDVIVIQWVSDLDVNTNPTYSGITITRSFKHEGGHGSDAGSAGGCIGVATGTSVKVSYSTYSSSGSKCYIWKVTT